MNPSAMGGRSRVGPAESSRLLDHSQNGPAIRLRQDLRPWSGSSTTSTTVQIAVAISPYPMAISNASDESTTDTGTIV